MRSADCSAADEDGDTGCPDDTPGDAAKKRPTGSPSACTDDDDVERGDRLLGSVDSDQEVTVTDRGMGDVGLPMLPQSFDREGDGERAEDAPESKPCEEVVAPTAHHDCQHGSGENPGCHDTDDEPSVHPPAPSFFTIGPVRSVDREGPKVTSG
jgi:hypothetical protein